MHSCFTPKEIFGFKADRADGFDGGTRPGQASKLLATDG
jgi:hypothetical protein